MNAIDGGGGSISATQTTFAQNVIDRKLNLAKELAEKKAQVVTGFNGGQVVDATPPDVKKRIDALTARTPASAIKYVDTEKKISDLEGEVSDLSDDLAAKNKELEEKYPDGAPSTDTFDLNSQSGALGAGYALKAYNDLTGQISNLKEDIGEKNGEITGLKLDLLDLEKGILSESGRLEKAETKAAEFNDKHDGSEPLGGHPTNPTWKEYRQDKYDREHPDKPENNKPKMLKVEAGDSLWAMAEDELSKSVGAEKWAQVPVEERNAAITQAWMAIYDRNKAAIGDDAGQIAIGAEFRRPKKLSDIAGMINVK
jgi:hypothetical protein